MFHHTPYHLILVGNGITIQDLTYKGRFIVLQEACT